MKAGVKCEIHSCTIAFTKEFLKEHFSEEDLKLLDTAFEARKDAQYYVNREVPDENYETLLKQTPAFLVKCKNTILNQKEIQEIRDKISSRLG